MCKVIAEEWTCTKCWKLSKAKCTYVDCKNHVESSNGSGSSVGAEPKPEGFRNWADCGAEMKIVTVERLADCERACYPKQLSNLERSEDESNPEDSEFLGE